MAAIRAADLGCASAAAQIAAGHADRISALLDKGKRGLYLSAMIISFAGPDSQFFYYIFGAITLAAAIQGKLAGSTISLVAGGILAVLILVGGYLLGANPTLGLILVLVGSLGVAGRFVPAFFKKGYALWPAGTLGLLGVIGVVLAIAGFLKK